MAARVPDVACDVDVSYISCAVRGPGTEGLGSRVTMILVCLAARQMTRNTTGLSLAEKDIASHA